MAFIFPKGVNTMKGLRERFYEVNPFTDKANPTVAEIEFGILKSFGISVDFSDSTKPLTQSVTINAHISRLRGPRSVLVLIIGVRVILEH